VLEGAAPRTRASSAGDRAGSAGASRSAFRVDPEGPLPGPWPRPGSTPEQVRLVVDVDGVGELDAVARSTSTRPGRRCGSSVDATRTALVARLESGATAGAAP
jgi:thiamine transport system ATP-binding protein